MIAAYTRTGVISLCSQLCQVVRPAGVRRSGVCDRREGSRRVKLCTGLTNSVQLTQPRA
jgi:hypothetical protein